MGVNGTREPPRRAWLRLTGGELPDWVHQGGIDRVRRARLVHALTALLIPSGVLLAVVCMVMTSPLVGGTILTVCALGLLVPTVMRRTRSVSWAGLYLCGILWLVTVAVTATTGGPHGEAIYFFILPPVLAVVVAGRRAGMWFTALSLLGVVFFEVLELWGLTPPNAIPDDQWLVDLVGRATLMVIIVSMGLMYEAFKEWALDELESVNAKLADEVVRHESTQADLERTHHELVAAARYAGMAQVATGVLHNVGNALNSVNVASVTLDESLAGARLDGLERGAALLERGDAPPAKLAAYLRKLGEQLAERHATAVREAQSIKRGVTHISQIIERQQSLAHRGGLMTDFSLEAAVDDAIRLAAAKPGVERVEFAAEASSVGILHSDRHRVLEILVNLLVNAGEASAGFAEAPRVVVHARVEARTVQICVRDNGHGIAPERLERLFAHGFTTKASGHGFGLHASANAATEIGGRLTAHSEGEGRGATFVLELPRAEASALADAG